MSDYRESPLGRIVEVGWGGAEWKYTGGADGTNGAYFHDIDDPEGFGLCAFFKSAENGASTSGGAAVYDRRTFSRNLLKGPEGRSVDQILEKKIVGQESGAEIDLGALSWVASCSSATKDVRTEGGVVGTLVFVAPLPERDVDYYRRYISVTLTDGSPAAINVYANGVNLSDGWIFNEIIKFQ